MTTPDAMLDPATQMPTSRDLAGAAALGAAVVHVLLAPARAWPRAPWLGVASRDDRCPLAVFDRRRAARRLVPSAHALPRRTESGRRAPRTRGDSKGLAWRSLSGGSRKNRVDCRSARTARPSDELSYGPPRGPRRSIRQRCRLCCARANTRTARASRTRAPGVVGGLRRNVGLIAVTERRRPPTRLTLCAGGSGTSASSPGY